MWNAIRSDLLDFVSTIAEDTTKTINNVIGEQIEEDEEITLREKMIADLKRSFNTYATPVDEQYGAQYGNFLKKFSLSSQASDIAELLDQEVDVPRYYAELVPAQVKPEEFWARYFFRLLLLSKEGVINLDDEDDEELLWETHDEKGQGLTPNIRKDSKDNTENENPTEDLKRIGFLEEDNLRLKGQVRALAGRVTELEKELALRDSIPSPSPFNAVLNAKPTITASNPLGDKIYSVPANSKLLCRKTITTNGPLSEGAALDSPTKESTMSKSTSLSLNTSLPPYATNESAGNNMNSVISSFKPIAASSSNTMNTIMGTRVSVTSSSATTHATESSTNTGSVSPLTEVTEGFIRRGAQRVTQPVNTLSNISGNVSMCTSEQEHNTFSNNDLHSETASEDSGVLVPVDRVFSTSSLGTKDGSVGAEMEMSGLNLISSFDSVSKQTLTPSQHSIIPVSPSANTAAVSVPHVQATLAAVQSVAAEKIVSKSVESVESASKTTDLAALDGDEEDDDGWS